ncbi:glycosyltransferase family 9 protein [Microtetraspora malaysiensis]|uniref:Glycosyltransferase family 9 protein n=1 Tax=Microtetraspora malaysiensis TaxID=161358 RepID=A0ABW6SRY2_9ACTN
MRNLLVEGVEQIAVLRANALGDFLLALPALEAVKRAYPAARLTLLAREWHARFLRGRPGPVDDVVALPPIRGVSVPADQAAGTETPRIGRLYDALRGRFDLALQMHGGGRNSNPFLRRLGARVTAGLRTPDAAPLDRWVPYVPYQHETLRFLEVARLVGAHSGCSLEPRVVVTRADWAELSRVVGSLPRSVVAVHPGANDARRRWPPERFAAVADRLGRPVVVTGTEPEREIVERVVRAMRGPAVPVVGELSIGGLAALYAACDLLIANDTGPRHLAAATGTPTVGVFLCVNLVNAGPLSRSHHRPLISWTTACPVCGADGTDPYGEPCEHRVSWVGDVTVEEAVGQARDLLGWR